MDTDLFQTLTIVLLAVIAVLLLLAYTALARLHRVLDERTSAWSQIAGSGMGSQPSPALETRAPAEQAPATEEAAPAAVEPPRAEPEPASAVVADESAEPARTEPAEEAAAETPTEEAEPDRREEPAAVGATAAEEPTVEQAPEEEVEPERQEAAATAEDTGRDAYGDEPQEQPFEREGRWWFRRGDELLVYEEQTGEWMPAPTNRAGVLQASSDEDDATGDGTGAAAAAYSAGSSEPSSSGRPSGWATQEATSGFWKCPSCGAVNGSTATSCRMCFTPRPEAARNP
jgi:hypothetical protein